MKALTGFPSVLDNLAKNLNWTSSLGEAYHNQPSEVMSAIQTIARQSQGGGHSQVDACKLRSYNKRPQTIVIQPANPQVVYVPEYNPAVIYGTPYVIPGYTAADVAAAGVIGFGAGVAIGALADGGCCGWGWNSWNCDWHGGAVVYNHNTFYGNTAWHGGYYHGGYHDGYGYHNAYNRVTVNNFKGSASRLNNVDREDDRNFDANRADSWAHHDSAFGRSNAFSGLGDRFGGLAAGLQGPTASAAGEACASGGFGGGRFGGGGFGGGGFGGFHGGFRR